MTEGLGLDDYRALYENSPDGVMFTIPDGRILAANPAACQILRMTEAEICTRGRQNLIDRTDGRWDWLVEERGRNGSVHGVGRMICGDGSVIETEVSASIFRDMHGEPRRCTIIRDVTERVAMEQKLRDLSDTLRELALVDDLTGLRNRRGFVYASGQVLEVARRGEVPAHLLFLDVDNMKGLNDHLGHSAGDAGLKAVGRALTSALRRADVVSRIGGDEFAVLIMGLSKKERPAIERRVRQYLRSTRTVEAVGMPVEVSLGWAEGLPSSALTVEQLLDRADAAMYEVKAARKR